MYIIRAIKANQSLEHLKRLRKLRKHRTMTITKPYLEKNKERRTKVTRRLVMLLKRMKMKFRPLS